MSDENITNLPEEDKDNQEQENEKLEINHIHLQYLSGVLCESIELFRKEVFENQGAIHVYKMPTFHRMIGLKDKIEVAMLLDNSLKK